MKKERQSKDLIRDEVIVQLRKEKSNLERQVKRLTSELQLIKISARDQDQRVYPV
jgi:cell division protein FtsB